MASAYRKFSSAECLAEIIKRATDTPSLIRDHVRIFTDEQNKQLVNTLWPAVFVEDNWFRTSTHRPSKPKDDPANNNGGVMLMGGGSWEAGTDKEVRVYENEVWSDNGRGLEATVTTEFGEFVSVEFSVVWN